MKLLITGGHPAPALACIDSFRKADISKTLAITYVGKKYISDRKEESFEYKEIMQRDLPFVEINPGRFTRVWSVRSLMNLLKIPFGIFEGLSVISKVRPDAVLSFGGYIAVPVTIAAFLKGIPVYTHEQAIHPGLANRFIARFAKKVFTSFRDSGSFIPYAHVIYAGNPVREQIFKVNDQLQKKLPQKHPVIFVTGGSLGSHSINVLIEQILPELLSSYSVIHQTGNVQEYNDFARLTELRQKLSPDLAANYYVVPHISGEDIGTMLSVADLVIGRAGANTFFDLLYLKKPALFIPLPWAAYNEQFRHAELFKKEGAGEIFDQYHSSSELLELIRKMITDLDEYKKHFNTFDTMTHEKAVAILYKEIVG